MAVFLRRGIVVRSLRDPQQAAGDGQPARPRRRRAFGDDIAVGAALVPVGFVGGSAIQKRGAGAHDQLGYRRGAGFCRS